MAEKPIIFNTDMVHAILEGRKTQTRRIMKPQPVLNNGFWQWYGAAWCDNIKRVTPMPCHSMYNNAPYQPGDILWVRETWAQIQNEGEKPYYEYFADTENPLPGDWPEEEKEATPLRWRPSIHMPREAARIFLRVTDIRIEQLQDISEEDAIAEGVKRYKMVDAWLRPTGYYVYGRKCHDTAREGFRDTWDELYSKGYSWDINPWVWVIKFEVL